MAENPLGSLADYGYFVAEVLNRPLILRSTIRVWSSSPYTGTAEGEAIFANGIRHPEDPSLASTYPHHKHIPPAIKRNRIPAPNLRFTGSNLVAIIEEIESLQG